MSLSLSELQHACTALNSLLSNGRVQDIRHPVPDALTLQFRVPGQTYDLLIHAGTGQSRICVTALKWPNSPTPTGFVAKLRKELLGSKLMAVTCAESERLVTLRFSRLTKDRDYTEHSLLCELTGHHANVFLVEPSGIILAQMLTSRSNKRTLRPGYVYEIPLQSSSAGTHNRLKDMGSDSIFAVIESWYSSKSASDERHERWTELMRATNSAIRKTQTTLAKVSGDAERASGANEIAKMAELVKAALPTLSGKVDSITTTDWYHPELRQVVIELNPALDPQANVARMFHQAKRLKAATDFIAKRVHKISCDLDSLLAIKERLLAKEREGDLIEESNQLRQSGWLKGPNPVHTNRAINPVRLCYREFTTENGSKIWVGKSAKDNDTLTVKFARSHDIWLHATGRRGAHVVLRLEKNQVPDPSALHDAALLAAHYSEGGKTDSGVEVAWTYRKYVRKIKHSATGSVTYSQTKTLWVTLDPERLRRLFQGEVASDPT